MANLQDSVLNWVEDTIPQVVNNSSAIFNIVLIFLFVVVLLLWLYCGVIIFNDARKRLSIENNIFFYLLLVLGMVFGPFALLFYYAVRPKYTKDELDFIKVEHKFYFHQASKVVDCLSCGAYVLEDQLYCTNCGTQNRFKCESCGAVTDYDDLYCSNCGKNFDGRYEKILEKIESKKPKSDSSREDKTSSIKSPDFSKIKNATSKAKQKTKDFASNVKSSFSRVLSTVKSKVQTKAKK